MVLAAHWRKRPDELRADLQEHYGIDIDHAMAGRHTAAHVAALTAQLPLHARVNVAQEPDARWQQPDVLLATLVNQLAVLMWGMSDPKKRGKRPQPIGPSYMTREQMRSLPARVLTIDELMEELEKPRQTHG